jgi:hypothetical protein
MIFTSRIGQQSLEKNNEKRKQKRHTVSVRVMMHHLVSELVKYACNQKPESKTDNRELKIWFTPICGRGSLRACGHEQDAATSVSLWPRPAGHAHE